jgi:carotenoid cleavage dioxygenase-like enzyme
MAGEPAFAPLGGEGGGDVGGPSHGGAVLLAPIWQPARNRSGLALFDPHDVAAGPRAILWFAARVRLGFHSFWSPALPA